MPPLLPLPNSGTVSDSAPCARSVSLPLSLGKWRRRRRRPRRRPRRQRRQVHGVRPPRSAGAEGEGTKVPAAILLVGCRPPLPLHRGSKIVNWRQKGGQNPRLFHNRCFQQFTEGLGKFRYLVGLVLYSFSLSSPQVWIPVSLGTPLLGGRITVGPGNDTPSHHLPKAMHFLPLLKPPQSPPPLPLPTLASSAG